MVEYIPPATIGASNVNSGSTLNGIDLLTGIQILLVQDYDDQLRSLGSQIKGTTKVKKAYRKDIEQAQSLLMKPVHSGSAKNGDEKVKLSVSEFNALNGNQEHRADPKTGDLLPDRHDPSLGDIKGDPIYEGQGRNRRLVGYAVRKTAIENKVDQVKLKLDTLNEQSELMSLSLQSLTNQRKIAFETISNMVNKEAEGVATIVRNIKN